MTTYISYSIFLPYTANYLNPLNTIQHQINFKSAITTVQTTSTRHIQTSSGWSLAITLVHDFIVSRTKSPQLTTPTPSSSSIDPNPPNQRKSPKLPIHENAHRRDHRMQQRHRLLPGSGSFESSAYLYESEIVYETVADCFVERDTRHMPRRELMVRS